MNCHLFSFNSLSFTTSSNRAKVNTCRNVETFVKENSYQNNSSSNWMANQLSNGHANVSHVSQWQPSGWFDNPNYHKIYNLNVSQPIVMPTIQYYPRKKYRSTQMSQSGSIDCDLSIDSRSLASFSRTSSRDSSPYAIRESSIDSCCSSVSSSAASMMSIAKGYCTHVEDPCNIGRPPYYSNANAIHPTKVGATDSRANAPNDAILGWTIAINLENMIEYMSLRYESEFIKNKENVSDTSHLTQYFSSPRIPDDFSVPLLFRKLYICLEINRHDEQEIIRILMAAVIYIERLKERNESFEISPKNFTRLLTASFVVAVKFFLEVSSPRLTQVARVIGISSSRLRCDERAFCKSLDYSLMIPSDLLLGKLNVIANLV